jgi:flagellar hook-associated protein 2
MQPLTNGSGTALTGQTDLASMGLKLSSDGKLSVDDSLLTRATTLQSRLADGVRIGYDSTLTSDLSTRITGMLASGGVLQDRIQTEQKVQTELNTKKTAMQSRLATVQARYFAQYGALDALIYKLQGTSDSLKSALDALTNSQSNN